MDDCIFCKIVKKEIKSKMIFEDNDIIAFWDINPQAPLHILIIPKKHIENILQISDDDTELIAKILKTINQISKEQNISESGFRIVINCNRDGGQTVPHLHFHLLGRRFMMWPPG